MSIQFKLAGALSAVAAAGGLMFAQSAIAQPQVSDPWVRATVPHQNATGAFMRITSDKDASLVAASSPQAGTVEVHEMKMDQGVMKMRPVDKLDLPAGKTVELKPGGYHLMLFNLKARAEAGKTVPITLVFEDKDGKREQVTLEAPVRALTSQAPAAHHSH